MRQLPFEPLEFPASEVWKQLKAERAKAEGSSDSEEVRTAAKQIFHVLDVLRNNLGGYGEVLTSNAWVEAPVGEDWIAAYRLVLQRGRPVVGELRVFPAQRKLKKPGMWDAEWAGSSVDVPSGGLPARTLRAIKIGEHLRFGSQALGWLYESESEESFKRYTGMAEYSPKATGPERKRARGRSELWYARLARDYVNAVQARERKPVEKVAAKHSLTAGNARVSVHGARKRGLLTAATPGAAGGQLTARARRVLGLKPPRPSRGAKKPPASKKASRQKR